jgi:DNA-binding PadR family transcriptional regulator
MSRVSQGLSTTSYALLGLLAFDGSGSAALTGYELKQRADRTLRFYWVSPAMSQVYSELERLADAGLVDVSAERTGRRKLQRYRITQPGLDRLQGWLSDTAADFPVLKHPTALRLLMGALIGPDRMRQLLRDYLDQLAERRTDLVAVRAALGDRESVQYPALVADWGLDYYDSETAIVQRLMERLPQVPATPEP